MTQNNFISYFWKFLERFSVQVTSFITTLVLARILSADEYGTVALVIVFISLATVFVQGGLNTALIQKIEIDEEDISTIFWVSIIVALICYVIIFFMAFKIANFYKKPIIIPVIRILAISLFPGALNSIQIAISSRKLEFKKIFMSSLIATVVAGIISIILAIFNFGVWAIVAWQLINIFISSILMLFFVKWKPRFLFSWVKFKNLIPFGSRILISNFLVTLFQNIRSLLIGGLYSTSDLAFFNRGKQFPQVLMDGVIGSIQTVSLPIFAKHQREKLERYKENMRKIITMSYLIIFPLLFGITVISKPLIKLLLTDKWLEAVPYLQIFALTYTVQPMQIICAEAIKGLGLSKVTLNLEYFRKFFEIGLLVCLLKYGPYKIAISALIAGVISFVISMYPNVKYLNYSIKEQIEDIIKPLIASIIMSLIVLYIEKSNFSTMIILLFQIVAGIFIYILNCWILKIKDFNIVINILKNKLI